MIILRQKIFFQKQKIIKDKEEKYLDMKKKYGGFSNCDFVSYYKTLSPEDQKYVSNRDADDFTDSVMSAVLKNRKK